MEVRRVIDKDRGRLAQMRRLLWPEEDPAELDADLPKLLADPGYAVLVAEEDGRVIGFAEVGVRSYAEGCTGPAGYLEGIWVEPAARRRGVAAALLAAGEDWVRARGLGQFGSDALLGNAVSRAWHKAAGFAEVERLVVFAKKLD